MRFFFLDFEFFPLYMILKHRYGEGRKRERDREEMVRLSIGIVI
jgi:hypothetical protein